MLNKQPNSHFENLMSYAERISRLNGASACALFVIQRDRVVAEYYSGTHGFNDSAREVGADSQFNVASVRKSYLGYAAAWALHHGDIYSLDDSVLNYLQVSDQEREAIEGVTVRHLLTNTHGLGEENGRIVRQFKPGTDWQYNGVGINLLQTLTAKALGKPYADLLHETVFQPLGWSETGFRTAASEQLVPLISEQGQYMRIRATTDGSQGNLFVSARELAFWGYLHMTSGKINGQAVVPAAVIRSAVTLQSPNQHAKGLPSNGCLWFIKNGESPQCTMGNDVPNNSFEIVGAYGPLVLVVPQLELVVVRMSNQEKGNYADHRGSHLDYLKEFSNLAVTCARRAV